MDSEIDDRKKLSILWFRHGLRLHDNPSLHEAVTASNARLLPIFIFDGESAGTWMCGYNRFTYLLECLSELDEKFRALGSRLHIFKSGPVEVFSKLHAKYGIERLCFEQDCEPIWKKRDEAVKKWCTENGISCIEKVGHTLWNPHEVIALNGGSPPVTFAMFNHVISSIGLPPRPLPDVDLTNVSFAFLPPDPQMGLLEHMPNCEDLGVPREKHEVAKVYIGGESHALNHLKKRLTTEFRAFLENSFLPNRRNPELLCPPKSLSPDLKFGSLSVRKFYWGVMDAYKKSQQGVDKPFNPQIVVQLLWREFFYTMSVNNEHYAEMETNEICINIPWYPLDANGNDVNGHFKAYCEGKTGYPFIDAGVRQLIREGWIHHIIRNALACFLTRGDLWLNWVDGANFFLYHLIDGDWSVNAGNWMWISSSAFEDALNCASCIDPATYGRRADPWGDYVKKFVPELANYPVEYIYEPWKADLSVQEAAGCVVGKDYPERIVIHEEASVKNIKMMNEIKQRLLKEMQGGLPDHVMPSSEEETRRYLVLPDETCTSHSHG